MNTLSTLMQNPEFLFHYWFALCLLAATVAGGWTWFLLTCRRPARAGALHDILADRKASLVGLVALACGYRVKWTNGYVLCYARPQYPVRV